MKSQLFRENAHSITDGEALTHILQFVVRDPEKLSDALLSAFGSIKNVLEARPEQIKNAGKTTDRIAEYIASMLGVVRVWQYSQEPTDCISNTRAAEYYCKSLLSGERVENFYVICLNARCKVVGTRKISTGSLSEVSAYPRKVIETALNYNAHSVILTHNHPGGTCAPSAEDIASTLQLQRLLTGLGIMLLDHIIIAGNSSYGMIQHGDIDRR